MNPVDPSTWEPEDAQAFEAAIEGWNVSEDIRNAMAYVFLSGMRHGLGWASMQNNDLTPSKQPCNLSAEQEKP